MPSYIGKVQISGSDPVLVGSTLYGICGTPAATALKDITASTNGSNNMITEAYVNTSYDHLLRGTTIHIKFINGNTVTNGASLLVGTVPTSQEVIGNFTCPANTIISFTLDEYQHWIVNDNVDTNTEYVFKTAYNATTNKAATEGDITSAITDLNLGVAATKAVVSDLPTHSSSNDLPTAAAVYSYIQSQTGGLAGLTGAMHFRGEVTDSNVTITNGGTQRPHIVGYDIDSSGSPVSNFHSEPGDVILFEDAEYVWNDAWILLGDEGSYVLKSSQTTDTIRKVTGWTDGTLPSFTIDNNTTASHISTSVTAGVLNISSTPVDINAAVHWTQGTMPVLTWDNTTVVVPVNTPSGGGN